MNNYIKSNDVCGSDRYDVMSEFPIDAALAMAYIPYQFMGEVYSDEEALNKGTLFPELDKPFTGKCNI